MSLADYANIAEIALTLITAIGVIVSLCLSVKALRQNEVDRQLRQRPYLAFEPGGNKLLIEFLRVGTAVPGIDPAWAATAFANLPEGVESVRLMKLAKAEAADRFQFYGRLTNYGLGPALSVHVTWVPREVWIGTEKFTIDEAKLLEPLYHAGPNTMPAVPTHILPSTHANLSRLPTFIDKDVERKITRVDGRLDISCNDVFGQSHEARQEFCLFTEYKAAQPHLFVTFGDIMEDEKPSGA